MTTGARSIRAPRGTSLTCLGLASGGRAADADEQSRSRGRRAARGSGRLRRHRQGGALVAGLRRHRRIAAGARQRRDAARAVGQAGRRVPHLDPRAARAHRQCQPRAEMGRLGHVPRSRGSRADDVRADDGRQLDLHRLAGHPAGHLRDAGRTGAAALRRHPRRPRHRHRRTGRHGRRPAARGDDERRRRARRRGGSHPHRTPAEQPLPR